MANTERLRLRVDVEPDASPISGYVAAGSGPEQAFVGWTELFAVLQALIAGHDDGSARTPGSP